MKRGDLVTLEQGAYRGKKPYGVIIDLERWSHNSNVEAKVQWNTGETRWYNVKSIVVAVEAKNEAG